TGIGDVAKTMAPAIEAFSKWLDQLTGIRGTLEWIIGPIVLAGISGLTRAILGIGTSAGTAATGVAGLVSQVGALTSGWIAAKAAKEALEAGSAAVESRVFGAEREEYHRKMLEQGRKEFLYSLGLGPKPAPLPEPPPPPGGILGKGLGQTLM